MLPIPFGFMGPEAEYIFQDDFNRTDSDTVGNGWVEEIGDWDISSNALLKTTSGNAWCSRSGDTIPNDQYAQVVSVTNLGTIGPFVRGGDFASGGDGYNVRILTSGTIVLDRLDNGSRTLIGTFSAGSYGTNELLKVQAVGSTIKAFDDVGERISVTDSTYTTGTVGVMATAFVGTHTCDDFEAGEV